MDALLATDTLRYAGSEWLREYPRYAKAAQHRISRLNGQYPKDQKALEMLTPWVQSLANAEAGYPGLVRLSPEARQYRWMLEEFRVSLFAQQMKTVCPYRISGWNSSGSRCNSGSRRTRANVTP
jgi:ATP-dependent helicase HrpA